LGSSAPCAVRFPNDILLCSENEHNPLGYVFSVPDLLSEMRSSDPEVALTAIRELRSEAEGAELHAVRAARREGFSWQRIASLLGRTRSSVWARYNDVVT
jgi:hypothetical protein